MTLTELKKSIVNKDFRNLYIFTGDECAIRVIYTHQIAESTNRNVTVVDTVNDAIAKSSNILVDISTQLFVVYEDKELLQKIDSYVNRIPNNMIVVCVYEKLDSRVAKKLDDYVTVFNTLTKAQLSKFVKEKTELDDKYCGSFIELCENSYSRILLERDKIYHYAKAKACDYNTAFLQLVKDGTIYNPPEDNVLFPLINSIMARDAKSAFDRLDDFLAQGDSVLGLLSLLYRNCKIVLQIQSCNNDDVETATGLTSQQIYVNRKYVGRYPTIQLVKALKRIREVDSAIKHGKMTEELAIKYVIINMI